MLLAFFFAYLIIFRMSGTNCSWCESLIVPPQKCGEIIRLVTSTLHIYPFLQHCTVHHPEIILRWKDPTRPSISPKSKFCLKPLCFLATFRKYRCEIVLKRSARLSRMSTFSPSKRLPKCSFRNPLDRYPTSSHAMSALLPELQNIISPDAVRFFADICGASTDCPTVLMRKHFFDGFGCCFDQRCRPQP